MSATYLAPDGQGLQFSYSPGQVAITLDTTGHSPLVVNAQLNSQARFKDHHPTRQVSYGYSGGLLTSFTDADGNTWNYAYSSGRLVSKTDPLGQVRLAVSYDPTTGRVTSEKQQGSPRHTDDTFTWNPATQIATRWALSNVNGTVTREPYTDQYIGNVRRPDRSLRGDHALLLRLAGQLDRDPGPARLGTDNVLRRRQQPRRPDNPDQLDHRCGGAHEL